MNPDNILMLDFETTGFAKDPNVVPLEGAAIIVDAGLNELAAFGPIAIHADVWDLDHMGDYVRDMHTKTGLLDRVAASTITVADFDRMLSEFAAPYFPAKKSEQPDGTKYRGMVIGGNSVKFDFDVIEAHFPLTLANMDYRVIDITSVGELFRRWNPTAWAAMPPKGSNHTAMVDIVEGIKELRYYRDCGLTP